MSDNDSINRGEVRREIAAYIHYNTVLVDEWAANCIDDIVERIPAVPQEMSAVEFLDEEAHICDSYKPTGRCSDCPIYKWCLAGGEGQDIDMYSDEYVAIVEKWAREHPETDMMTAKYALPRIDLKEGSDK